MNDVSQDGPDPLIGANIGGKYCIVTLLGEGGMGCVYLGEQQMGSSVRKVAVKTLHKHLSMDPQIRARFSRECGTVSELEHPNTIQVYDFGTTDDGLLYIVMEFVQGRSLADILEKDGPMPADRVLNILTQVCGSLEEAHHRGIVHRDLKPDNVVLCEKAGKKDWVEVLDFGIAKRSSESDPNEQKLTQQGMVLGTPPYMSPEQFTGQPINATSDIYSLGVMTYEMLTGKLPFNGNTAWEWASQHMTAQPQPFEVQPNGNLLPPAMRAAVMRSLEKAPEARFATVTDYLEALKGGPVSAPVAQPPSGGAGRAKTEMAAPAVSPPGMAPGAYGPPPGAPMGGPPMGGPPMGGPPMGGPPMGGPPMGGPPMGGPPAYAAVPAGPAHSSGRKSGGAGLFIGLGIGALVLIGGGIAVAVSMSSGSSSSTQPTGALTFSSPPPTASASASSAPTEEHHDDGNLAALNTSKATGGGGGGGGGAGPKATGKASAIPTPGKATTAPTAPPAACALAARYKGTNPTMYERYATLCRAGGGTPP